MGRATQSQLFWLLALKSFTSTIGAFAAKKGDGSVVTWGAKEHGGDSSSLTAQLAGRVQHIYSNEKAFAAKKEDGIIIAWGDPEAQSQLVGVAKAVVANEGGTASACLKTDGSVVTWGIISDGGDSSRVAMQLAGGVQRIFARHRRFGAVKEDGTLLQWGDG